MDWTHLRGQKLAALGYHSPNMKLAHLYGLERAATASDQESVALLVLTGAFAGFLSYHYAQPLIAAGRIRTVAPEVFRYTCRFSAIMRQASKPSRLAKALFDTLCTAHHGVLQPEAAWPVRRTCSGRGSGYCSAGSRKTVAATQR